MNIEWFQEFRFIVNTTKRGKLGFVHEKNFWFSIGDHFLKEVQTLKESGAKSFGQNFTQNWSKTWKQLKSESAVSKMLIFLEFSAWILIFIQKKFFFRGG